MLPSLWGIKNITNFVEQRSSQVRRSLQSRWWVSLRSARNDVKVWVQYENPCSLDQEQKLTSRKKISLTQCFHIVILSCLYR